MHTTWTQKQKQDLHTLYPKTKTEARLTHTLPKHRNRCKTGVQSTWAQTKKQDLHTLYLNMKQNERQDTQSNYTWNGRKDTQCTWTWNRRKDKTQSTWPWNRRKDKTYSLPDHESEGKTHSLPDLETDGKTRHTVYLNSIGVLRLCQNVQQLIVAQEVEAWEDKPLGFQVILKSKTSKLVNV